MKMEIKKTIYYKLDEDDMMSLYESFSNYCFMNDLDESWETFREYYNDMCVEENWNPIEEIFTILPFAGFLVTIKILLKLKN